VLKFEIKDRPGVAYHERLYTQVRRDALTGLWNHNYGQEELEKLLSTSSRRNEAFSLLLMDLDFFQVLNETYGQTVGDAILRARAQRVVSQLSNYETAVRWAGTQFMVLLPEAELQGAVTTAERLRQALSSFDFSPLGCSQRITMSAGVAQFPICGSNSEELV